MLQLFHLYPGKVSISTKNGIAEGGGVLEHSRAKLIFSTILKITPKHWHQKFLRNESFEREAVAEPYFLIRKQDNSLMILLVNRQIPNCPQLRLSPRKYR